MTNILLIGDSFSGKSTWLRRIRGMHYIQSYITTIGVDTHILMTHGRKVIVHDIGGHDRFITSKQSYYAIADGVILFYNTADQRIQFWKDKVHPNIPLELVATKGDLIRSPDIKSISSKDDPIEKLMWPLTQLLSKIPMPVEEPTFLERLMTYVYTTYSRYYNRLLRVEG